MLTTSFQNSPFATDAVALEPVAISRHILLIAEIGINHNGDVEIAKRLIDMAKDAGWDAVKFQKRTIDIVYSEEVLNSPRESPWGTTQRAQKEGLEFGQEEFEIIAKHCREKGIEWFASAWDMPSQEFLQQFDMPYNKVASAMITHLDFLQEVARERRPTFISTGMTTFGDIDRAVEIFRGSDCPFMLMHTVSEYPSPEADLNLAMIPSLRKRYGCSVGYSGHEASVSPSVIAAAMGAAAIERHITLDRAMYGSDQAASLEWSGVKALADQVRKVPTVAGDAQKRITEGEAKVAEKLRYWA